LKISYQILIIFGKNIFDTTCDQILFLFLFLSVSSANSCEGHHAERYRLVFHLTQCMLLHYLRKADQAKYVLK